MPHIPRNYEELRRAAQAAEDANDAAASHMSLSSVSPAQNKSQDAETSTAEEPSRPENINRAATGPAGPGMVEMNEWANNQIKEQRAQRQADKPAVSEEGQEEVTDARRRMIEDAQSRDLPPAPDETDPHSASQGRRK